jgi:hypothetical protein
VAFIVRVDLLSEVRAAGEEEDWVTTTEVVGDLVDLFGECLNDFCEVGGNNNDIISVVSFGFDGSADFVGYVIRVD